MVSLQDMDLVNDHTNGMIFYYAYFFMMVSQQRRLAPRVVAVRHCWPPQEGRHSAVHLFVHTKQTCLSRIVSRTTAFTGQVPEEEGESLRFSS